MVTYRGIGLFGEVSSLYSCMNMGKRNVYGTPQKIVVRSFRSTRYKHSRWSSRNGANKSSLGTGAGDSSFKGVGIDYGPIPVSKLLKPLGFTVAFSSATFVGATIWQYENMRAHAIAMVRQPYGWFKTRIYGSRKEFEWRQQINNWWNSLTEGQRLFAPICFANVLIFLAWRVPQFQRTMVHYFCSNPASRVLCWPMVLSTFSHYSAFHLFANMYVLHSFSTGAVAALGKEQFLALYLSAGVVSSMSSYIYKAVTSQPGLSLGASGAIMAVLGYVCTQFPETKLSIIFLPFFTFTAGSAIKVIMAVDATCALLGWKFFDHAAHLGGAICGIAWSYWGNSIWEKREPILHYWHAVRGAPKK